jgi:Sigma-70 region 2
LNERDLIQGCVKKDTNAQHTLFVKYAGILMTICPRYAKDQYEAEDMLQESFISIFGHINQFKFAGSFEGWIKRITVNAANVLMDSVDGVYLNTINVVKFVDSNTGYYKGSQAIYKTSDGGQTWNLNCQVGADYLIGMSFLDIHTGWACTSRGRILKIQL